MYESNVRIIPGVRYWRKQTFVHWCERLYETGRFRPSDTWAVVLLTVGCSRLRYNRHLFDPIREEPQVSKNKPLPKDHPLHHASKELIAAVTFYEKMISNHLGDFAQFDSFWREFLQKLERAWNKAEAAVSDSPRCKRIIDTAINRRKTDPLLSYLRHARNADEHSLQEVAKDWDAKLRAEPSADGITLHWDKWDRPLLPVTNRGVVYDPPRLHLGQGLNDKLGKGVAEPIVVADLALHFYRNLLNQLNETLSAPD